MKANFNSQKIITVNNKHLIFEAFMKTMNKMLPEIFKNKWGCF